MNQVNGLGKLLWKEGSGRERASYKSAILLLGTRNWGGGAIDRMGKPEELNKGSQWRKWREEFKMPMRES